MKFLVTGGAGFIGSHLVDFFLKKKHNVLVFDNLSTGRSSFLKHNLDNPRFTFVKLDLTNLKVLEQNTPASIDAIFHLAANSDVMLGTTNPDIDFNNSIVSTFNLLKTMKIKGIKKIFYTSGSGIYGDVGTRHIGENHGPLFPVSFYGATKLSAEALIYAFSHQYDIQSWVLRPANIIGPRSTHGVIFDFINKLMANQSELTILGSGKQTKSYLYITDVLEAMNIVFTKATRKINLYNISSTSFIKVDEIAKIVIEEMGLRNVKIKRTGKGTEGGWRGDVPILKLKSSLIKNLGWKARYSSRQAVTLTVRSLLKNGL